MKKVLIVEDQRMARENMERMIADKEGYALACSITSAELALPVCKRQKIDLVLMDIVTTGQKNGIEAAAEIKKNFPEIKVIIVTSTVESGHLDIAKEHGIDGFWYKNLSETALSEVIDQIMAGGTCLPDKTPSVTLGMASSDDFTAAELRVLKGICNGLEYHEISKMLDISVNTVKYHVSNILSKTGYANRVRLAIAVTNKQFIIPNLPEDKLYE